MLCVGMLVVKAMVTGPPQRITLGGSSTQQRQNKLKRPAGFEGFVGKVTVKSGGKGKHVQ
jgi:hypothetical protein